MNTRFYTCVLYVLTIPTCWSESIEKHNTRSTECLYTIIIIINNNTIYIIIIYLRRHNNIQYNYARNPFTVFTSHSTSAALAVRRK